MDLAQYLTTVEHWRERFLSVGVPGSVLNEIMLQLGTWRDWPKLWEARGDREREHATEQSGKGRSITATEGWMRATLYYHFGQFILFDDEDLRWRLATKKEDAFEQALPGFQPAGTKIAVESEHMTLYGVLRLPERRSGSDTAVVVIVLPGADSTKEEYQTFEHVLLRRGMATFTVDGPGQGETRRGGGPFQFDYEGAFPAIVNFLGSQEAGSFRRVGLVGFSFGGYLAPRVAARCPQIEAAVTLGGCFDLSYWEDLPPLLKDDLGYLFGASNKAEARELATAYVSLEEVVPSIRAPLLAVHGSADRIFPVRDTLRVKELKPDTDTVVYDGGDHCCHNVSHYAKPMIADWLAEKLHA